MLALARVMVLLAVLAGCNLPAPPNSGPCQTAPGSRECQDWTSNREGGGPAMKF
jgi:hypothetical protein